MKFYINRFGNTDSGKKFDNYDDFITEVKRLVGEAAENGDAVFEILWDSGEASE